MDIQTQAQSNDGENEMFKKKKGDAAEEFAKTLKEVRNDFEKIKESIRQMPTLAELVEKAKRENVLPPDA